MVAKAITRIASAFRKEWLFPLLAFLVPLILRAVPEILMSPYLVGFDTIGYYVPVTSLWLKGGLSLWSYLSAAPLFYSMVVFFVSLGGPLVAVLKIVPVLLHGFLGLSIYGYAKKGLGWSAQMSTLTAIVATVYFVALRVSWDLLRNELALVFLFAVLTLLSMKQSSGHLWRRYLILSLTMMAVVLAHQLVTVIMLGIVVVTIIQKLLQKEHAQASKLFLASLPSALFFIIVYFNPIGGYVSLNFSGNVWPLSDFSSYPSMLAGSVGFFFYCYLPLLPLALLSARRFGNLQLRSWLLLSLILVLLPIGIVSNFRWLLLLIYPLAFYVSAGLSWLKSISWKRFRITAHRIAIVYLIFTVSILSLGFTLMTSEKPLAYFDGEQFNSYKYQIPTSMLQNTVSLTDCSGVASVLQWFKNNIGGDALLLTHEAFYGWGLTTLDENQMIYYGFGDPVQAAETAIQKGNNQIYLIWWTNGTGWYGQSTLPTSFEEVYRSGRIVLYQFIVAN